MVAGCVGVSMIRMCIIPAPLLVTLVLPLLHLLLSQECVGSTFQQATASIKRVINIFKSIILCFTIASPINFILSRSNYSNWFVSRVTLLLLQISESITSQRPLQMIMSGMQCQWARAQRREPDYRSKTHGFT